MTTNNYSANTTVSPQANDDVIDLRQVAAALGRQKGLIGAITIATALLSSLYAYTRKSVWQGSFQIVLENQSSGSVSLLAQLAASNPSLAKIAGFNQTAGNSSLETEVKILESPSVLKPIFEFVKTSKTTAGEDVSEFIYTNWIKNNLTVQLVKKTSVLNLVYQDSNKSLVLPVLNRISKTYQEYSKSDSTRSINNSLKFANEQAKVLREKAKDSNRKVDAFKFTHGISDETSIFTGSRINSLAQSPLPQPSKGTDPLQELAEINKQLTLQRLFFTEADPSVQRLIKERQAILQYIDQTGGGLISISSSGSKELNREILLEYKELQRTATRDNAALLSIESELLSLQIQKAQELQPWKLISTPTVLAKPVAPQRRNMVALGLFAGLVFGSGAALIRDYRSGVVFSEDELKTLLPCPLLERLPANAPQKWSNTAHLLVQGPLTNAESVALVPVGDVVPAHLEQLSQALRNALGHRQLLVSSDLLTSRNCSTQVLVTGPGAPQRQQLQQLVKQLALQGTPLAGWLLIVPELEA